MEKSSRRRRKHLDSQVKLQKTVSIQLAQRLPPHPRAELQEACVFLTMSAAGRLRQPAHIAKSHRCVQDRQKCKFNLRKQQKAVFVSGDKVQSRRERGEISNR